MDVYFLHLSLCRPQIRGHVLDSIDCPAILMNADTDRLIDRFYCVPTPRIWGSHRPIIVDVK